MTSRFPPRARRGFVYTLCILFLTAVLLELLAFNAEWAGHRRLDVQPPSDAEVLAYRANELSWLTRQAMGINATLSRNITNLTLNISDMGFPFINNSNGSIQVGTLKSWLEKNWTNITHTSLTFNVSLVNDSGSDPVWSNDLLQTIGGINYSHANFYNSRDIANLSLPGNYSPTNLSVYLSCSRPANTSSITYTKWASPGGGMYGNATYTDPVSGSYTSLGSWATGVSNSFAANYTDSNGLWLQTIHADWMPYSTNDSLLIWDEGNTSYVPAYNKWNITCFWNLSLTLNYSNQSAEALYIPVNTTLGYGNSSYNGYLTIARD